MKKSRQIISLILTIVMLFTTVLSSAVIAYASLLPLKEVKSYLILNEKTDAELKAMNLDDVLSMLVDKDGNKIEISSAATTAWRYVKSDEDGIEEYISYSIGKNEKIDLSADDAIKSYIMELIIGSSNQLDKNNIRYIIKVFVTNVIEEKIDYVVYKQTKELNRIQVIPNRINTSINEQLFSITTNEYVVPELADGESYFMSINSLASEHPNLRLEVYDFWDYIFNMTSAVPLTNSILNQDMKKSSSGFAIDYATTNMFAVIYYDRNNNIVTQSFVSFAVVKDTSYIDGSLWISENSQLVDAVLLNVDHVGFDDIDSIFAAKGIHEICLMLREGISIDQDLFCKLNAHGKEYGDEANSHITKAVKGHYDSLEDTVSCDDIKQQLFSNNNSNGGYQGNFNYKNGGVPFTVFFDDGNVWKLSVLAMEYNPRYDENYFRPFTEKPIIGEADPWLRVVGANGIDDSKIYVIENGKNINMDTYYGYGYQTVLINDANVDLSHIGPRFDYANTDRVYAVSKDTGNRVDMYHIRDFSNKNQQYTGIIIDNNKENERNYWVTFKKLNNSGSELFVYGPNAREVILDEYFEFKHDILIANVGNKPLTNIKVELRDAENVKLDPYWTVGSDGNNTLAAFTTTSKTTQYGELPNLAKIRLLPDGDGTVKGTLIITADGQAPYMITLNGKAQNPEIVTETLSDAVKYVPYQHIIATNNMHDWVDTQFTVSEGTLPDGVTLNVDTGEIYGVPKVPEGSEEVTYTFTVEAKYLVDGVEGYFDSSYKEFTLKVKPNTDENVYLATDIDDGYQIKEHIGTQVGAYSFELQSFVDTIFTSNGEYGEFVGLWLNGEKLKEGIDYDSESGSTKITIKSQTFENKTNPDAPNTIAMEFRKDTDGDGKGDSGAEMNRTAQNFTVKTETNVDKVIKLIAALPSNITLSDKGAVVAARNAYNALGSSEKSKVTNYSKLTAAEAKIKELEEAAGNQALIDNVIALINKIPSNVTLNDKQTVQNARNAYDALSSSNKAKVTNYSKLTSAENRIKELEQIAKDQAAANEVIVLIRAIPSTVRLSDKATVENARKAYDKLTSVQKTYVTNYEHLVLAENAIKQLEDEQAQTEKDKAEAAKVVSLISALPSNITLNDKNAVVAARSAYDKLTTSQKSYVTNYERLTKAEAAITQLEKEQEQITKDKQAAEKVIKLIDDIPSTVSLEDKTSISNARNAYNLLTAPQKGYVTNYSKLQKAENDIAQLEAAAREQAKINEVISLIDEIPDTLTLKDKVKVDNARKAYDALTSSQKNGVINYSDLVNAEAAIAALEAQENADKADKAAAQVVIDLISALPNNVSISDKADVEEARNSYNKLTETQKKLVSNYSVLVSAEEKIKSIEDYESANKKDQEAAKTVIDLIDELPSTIKLDDKPAVEVARKAYDKLTDKQKSIVTNYDVLANAEVEIAKLENNEYVESESVTFVGIIVDENGKPISNAVVELHSKVQTARTDKNGSFKFSDVEFGEHNLFLKDDSGNVIAKATFKILPGTDLSIKDDEITAADGAEFTVSIKKNNEELLFTKIEEGDKAPIVTPDDNKNEENNSVDIGDEKPSNKPNDKEDDKGIYIGEDTSSNTPSKPMPSIPNTGVETHITFWFIMLICSIFGLIATTVPQIMKKRIKAK